MNPSAKHAFLKFLLEQSKDKQIFLATHDPTFVNPVLWNNENVSIYLFSLVDSDFVKVNLTESREDPNTFAGYLPHTTSLKPVHIYVEGSLDVYIFQIFLNKYARQKFNRWYQIVNKVGIYHLGGDFWSHLLYTIPKKPYTSIVVLDGDKKEIAEKVVSKYSTIEKGKFFILKSLEDITLPYLERFVTENPEIFETMRLGEGDIKQIISSFCFVYCLKRSEIEDYLEPRPPSKEKGPLVADKMHTVPDEIEKIFDVALELAGIEV